jgi:uncharacterized membrane protein
VYTLIKWLHLLALIVWVGEIVFFSFVVAPGLFRTFDAPDAGRAVGAIFPIYYRVGYVCGVVLIATCLFFLARGSAPAWWGFAGAASAVMLAATLYAGIVLQPRASAMRPLIHDPAAGQAVKDEFGRLHRLAVILNGVVLLCGLGVSVVSATKLQP